MLPELLGVASLYLWYRGEAGSSASNAPGSNILKNGGRSELIGRSKIPLRNPREARFMRHMDTSTVGLGVREDSTRTMNKKPVYTNADLKFRAKVLRSVVKNRAAWRRHEPFMGSRRDPVPISDGRFPRWYATQNAFNYYNDGAGTVAESGRIRDYWK